jgi:hypothetical protein
MVRNCVERKVTSTEREKEKRKRAMERSESWYTILQNEKSATTSIGLDKT